MRIGKQATWAVHKRFDENREIITATDGKEKAFFVKALACDFQKERQYCSCCNKFSRRFDLEHKEWICDECEKEV